MAGPSENERAHLYRIAGAGMEFFASVMGCMLVGYLLDRWLGTAPVLLLIGVGLGFGLGLYRLVKLMRASERK
jgi:F0F1-type ATP synthase assembly protein I